MAGTFLAQDGSGDITQPLLITGFSSDRQSPTIAHEYLDGSLGAVLLPARPRSGTMTLLYPGANGEAESLLAEYLFARPTTFELDGALPLSADMQFYVPQGGTIRREQDTTRRNWTLTISFQEVQP